MPRFAAFVWLALAALFGAVLAAPLAAQDWKALTRILDNERTQKKIPGYAAGVYWRGQIVWLRANGLADLGTGRKVDVGTPFRTASIAKALTAVGLMRLQEAAKLSLDEEIHEHCPGFPPKPSPILLSQLLGHLGGIRHYKDESDRNNQLRYASVAESLRRFASDPLVADPGEQFLYSTYGFSLVGCAIEGAAGIPYAKWMQEQVFGPAGMTGTGVDDGSGVSARRAQGYKLNSSGAVAACAVSDNTAKVPGGGLVTTARDLLQFADALYRNRLLRGESIKRMWTSGQLRSGRLTGYGLGWTLSRSPDGDQEIFHTGEQQGASAMLYLRPQQRFAFVWLANLEGVENRVQLSRRVYRLVSGR
jgi:serine beta-lactamase-like protein LACTB, mitochondrial